MKLKKIRKIVIFFLITTVVFVFEACGSENAELTSATKTNLALEEKKSSDLEKEKIEEMKNYLFENGIDLEANYINLEDFSAYISENYGTPEDYVAYIEDSRNTSAWDLESEFACFAIWNDVKYLTESINGIGVNLDAYDMDPYTLLGYIGEYCNGNVDTFIKYINENYPNDFASFTGLVDQYVSELAMKAELQAKESTETYGETEGYQGDPLAGYGLPPGGNPLLEGYYEKSFMGKSITDEVIENQIKMQYGFSITE